MVSLNIICGLFICFSVISFVIAQQHEQHEQHHDDPNDPIQLDGYNPSDPNHVHALHDFQKIISGQVNEMNSLLARLASTASKAVRYPYNYATKAVKYPYNYLRSYTPNMIYLNPFYWMNNMGNTFNEMAKRSYNVPIIGPPTYGLLRSVGYGIERFNKGRNYVYNTFNNQKNKLTGGNGGTGEGSSPVADTNGQAVTEGSEGTNNIAATPAT